MRSDSIRLGTGTGRAFGSTVAQGARHHGRKWPGTPRPAHPSTCHCSLSSIVQEACRASCSEEPC